jgi:tRNA G18 (ribose-2'-O)-methylase SpoU
MNETNSQFRRKLQNSELNRPTLEEYRNQKKRPIVLVLDNIRSQHNIGAAFRTADAFCIQKIILCGICATPPNAEIHKAALGAELSVAWQYFKDTLTALQSLKSEGFNLIAIEQTLHATLLNHPQINKTHPTALIFGNEVNGVSQEAVNYCHSAIEIPQFGTKHSLNVSVSIGIVLWEYCR